MLRHSPWGEQRSDLSHSLISKNTETLIALQIILPLILTLSSISLKSSFYFHQLCKQVCKRGSFSRVTKSSGITLNLCIGISMFCCIILSLYHTLWWRWADESDLWEISKSSILANISALGEFSVGSISLLFAACCSACASGSMCYQQIWRCIFPSRLISYNLKPNALFCWWGMGMVPKRLLHKSLSFFFFNLAFFIFVNLKNKHFFLIDVLS